MTAADRHRICVYSLALTISYLPSYAVQTGHCAKVITMKYDRIKIACMYICFHSLFICLITAESGWSSIHSQKFLRLHGNRNEKNHLTLVASASSWTFPIFFIATIRIYDEWKDTKRERERRVPRIIWNDTDKMQRWIACWKHISFGWQWGDFNFLRSKRLHATTFYQRKLNEISEETKHEIIIAVVTIRINGLGTQKSQ